MTKHRQNHRTIWLVGLILVLLGAGAGGYFWWRQSQANNTSSSVTTPEESTDKTKAVDSPESTNQSQPEPTYLEGKTPEQYAGQTADDEPAYHNEQFRIPEGVE